ncbi:hypothetical protein HBNCFIEN_03513 (plasmid) [Legionella sp. PC997]|nr:hypothetical protein HBNCFIEN_03513 [Legionella sp. PC997]
MRGAFDSSDNTFGTSSSSWNNDTAEVTHPVPTSIFLTKFLKIYNEANTTLGP